MTNVPHDSPTVNAHPGAAEFRRFVEHVRTHKLLPDTSLNGNMGDFATWAKELSTQFGQYGYDGFDRSLKVLLNHEQLVMTALSQPDEKDNQEDYFKFLEYRDLKTLPPPKWLVYRFLPTKGVNFIYGPAGDGKTYLVTGLNASIATDNDWMGLATKHGHCIVIAAEDIDEVAQRYIGWALHHELQDIPRLHIFPASLQLISDTPKLIESIKHAYGDIDIAMITIDTLAMCSLGVEENSKKEFDAVTAKLDLLWRTFDCCVVAVHHTGRNGEIRGTSSMDGVGYSMIKVKKDEEGVLVHSDKMRRGKKFEDFHLEWVTVDIPGQFDEIGEKVTTGVLIRSDRVNTDPSRITPFQQEILDHVKNLGGIDVPRSELLKACQIDRSHEPGFVNTVSTLVGKGRLKLSKVKQRTFYTSIELL